MNVTITGLQEAQQANAHNIAQLKPNGAMGKAVRHATILAQQYATAITHVDTGALRASHRMDVRGTRGMIYLDPTATNPRSGAATARYGPVEHARGGPHAFYQRTEQERGLAIAEAAGEVFTRELM